MLWDIAIFVAGLVLLGYSAERVVKYAILLAKQIGIDRYGIGAGILAAITSTPELAVAVMSVLEGKPDIAVGTAFGSVVGLYLLSLGFLGLLGRVRFPQKRKRELIRAITVVVFVTVLAVFFGTFHPALGLILMGIYVWYARSLHEGKIRTLAENSTRRKITPTVGKLVLAFTLLLLAAEMIVKGVGGIAEAAGVPEFFIAFFLVALGTNLPEITVEVTAALKGHEEIAIGDILGSGVADLTLVLGAAVLVGWIVGCPVVFDGRTHVISAIMLGVALVGAKVSKGEEISVWESIGLIIAYILVIWTEMVMSL